MENGDKMKLCASQLPDPRKIFEAMKKKITKEKQTTSTLFMSQVMGSNLSNNTIYIPIFFSNYHFSK